MENSRYLSAKDYLLYASLSGGMAFDNGLLHLTYELCILNI
jgi:alcohol dehydrogenase class IV